MVARTPLSHKKFMVVSPLSPAVLRQAVKKVDECMTRLKELQYTVTGGNKVLGGVKLSPTSTNAYLKTSLRCKQESIIRIRNNGTKRSPTGKFPASRTGEWRKMSLKSMLVGETLAEIIQVSKFTKEILGSSNIDDPKTPLLRKQRSDQEKTPIETRRKREKQHKFRIIQAESNTPSAKRARSRINFKVSPPKRSEFEKETAGFSSASYHIANKVSPKHKPWVKKTVLFRNPIFHSSPTSQKQKFCKIKSPVIAKKTEIPHKFLVKSPVKIKSPQKGFVSASPVSKFSGLSRKSPPKQQISTASKLRRSLSPSRIANRFVSPLKGRRNSMASSLMMMPMRFSASRMAVEKGN